MHPQNPAKKCVILGVSGGIAAYKTASLTRLLRQQGHDVHVVMTPDACRFVHPDTFRALSANPVLLDTREGSDAMAHIRLVRAADAILIAPASANTIAKIAHGLADNLLSELVAARSCPLALAPAMNSFMWDNPANLRNIKQLQSDGIHIFGPESGEQACGEIGLGRMVEPSDLVERLADLWTPSSLAGKRVLISAGAGFEAIDPVRGITNISSGRMGLALASAARAAGAKVSLVHGKLQHNIPHGLFRVVEALSGEKMFDTIMSLVGEVDVFISVAAVADFRPAKVSSRKMKKSEGAGSYTIELIENKDILSEVAALEKPPFCVGFAAESHDMMHYARQKRVKKGIPLLIANNALEAMGSAHNQITLIDENGEKKLPLMEKRVAAYAIISHVAAMLNEHESRQV